MASIRRAVPGDAQEIGVVFDAAVREGWTYLGELAREPMFPLTRGTNLSLNTNRQTYCWSPSMNQAMSSVSPPSIRATARCSCGSFTPSTLAVAAHCSMPRMRRCEPQAAAKPFSTRTKKTKERSQFTRPLGIDATAPCVNRTFAVYTCASHDW